LVSCDGMRRERKTDLSEAVDVVLPSVLYAPHGALVVWKAFVVPFPRAIKLFGVAEEREERSESIITGFIYPQHPCNPNPIHLYGPRVA